MDILYISPTGGPKLDLVTRLRTGGHRVATYGATPDAISKVQLFTFIKHATLAVVDGPFPVEPTSHGSWRPSVDSLFIEETRRHHAALAAGSTPTVDLLVGDRRYFRKWCRRLGLPYTAEAAVDSVPWESGAWYRERDIVPDGPYLRVWQPLFKSVRFRGWFELRGYISPHESAPVVTGCAATIPVDSIPEGREAEFLQALVQ